MEYINIEWGTDLKLKIHVDPVLKDKEEGSESLEDTYVSISQCIDFYIEAFTKGKKGLKIEKSQMFPVLEDDNGVTNDYIIMIETKKLDPGILKLKLTAHYDDDHASYLEDNNRTEVVCKTTNYNIIKTI